MRHLPVITHHLRHVLSHLQASRHSHRRLLLARRRDVIDDVDGGRHAVGVLRHSDVIRDATGEKKGLLCDAGAANWFVAPDCLYRRHCATVDQSSCFTGKL